MLFNTSTFALFFSIILILYWILRGAYQWQNLLLLIGNYIFYGWLSWKFLIVIAFISVISLIGAGIIENSEKKIDRKIAVWTSCLFIGGMLAILKYCNFFLNSIHDVVSLLGIQWQIQNLNLSFFSHRNRFSRNPKAYQPSSVEKAYYESTLKK